VIPEQEYTVVLKIVVMTGDKRPTRNPVLGEMPPFVTWTGMRERLDATEKSDEAMTRYGNVMSAFEENDEGSLSISNAKVTLSVDQSVFEVVQENMLEGVGRAVDWNEGRIGLLNVTESIWEYERPGTGMTFHEIVGGSTNTMFGDMRAAMGLFPVRPRNVFPNVNPWYWLPSAYELLIDVRLSANMMAFV
jgi:hypothetical protein